MNQLIADFQYIYRDLFLSYVPLSLFKHRYKELENHSCVGWYETIIYTQLLSAQAVSGWTA